MSHSSDGVYLQSDTQKKMYAFFLGGNHSISTSHGKLFRDKGDEKSWKSYNGESLGKVELSLCSLRFLPHGNRVFQLLPGNLSLYLPDSFPKLFLTRFRAFWLDSRMFMLLDNCFFFIFSLLLSLSLYIYIFVCVYVYISEKAMAPHSSTLAWKIPWVEEPGRLQSMGSLRVGHDWATSLSLFTSMHWRRKWQPTPVFLPEESQGRGILVGCHLWGRTELDMTEVT